jgi:hypothetical protein
MGLEFVSDKFELSDGFFLPGQEPAPCGTLPQSFGYGKEATNSLEKVKSL